MSGDLNLAEETSALLCHNRKRLVEQEVRRKRTRARQWATKVLREYITKGFVLNDELMKNGWPFGRDYFDELLERIREIRASERWAYQKIADIFEQCSCDYEKNSKTTKAFYATIWDNLLPVSGKAEEF